MRALLRNWLGYGLLAVGPAVAACSGGDIYVDNSSPKQSDLSCAFHPGEDACARPLEGLAEQQRATVRATTALIAHFASRAHEARERVERACGTLIDHLGHPRPVGNVCEAAAAALRARAPAAFRLVVAPSTCKAAPLPGCVAELLKPEERPETCTRTVSLTLDEGATPSDQALGGVLRDVVSALPSFEEYPVLTGLITGRADLVVLDDAANAQACQPTVVSLAATATADVQSMAESASALTEAASVYLSP